MCALVQHYFVRKPPSTGIDVPVMQLEPVTAAEQEVGSVPEDGNE